MLKTKVCWLCAIWSDFDEIRKDMVICDTGYIRNRNHGFISCLFKYKTSQSHSSSDKITTKQNGFKRLQKGVRNRKSTSCSILYSVVQCVFRHIQLKKLFLSILRRNSLDLLACHVKIPCETIKRPFTISQLHTYIHTYNSVFNSVYFL